jgi:hypothetical protein
MTAHTSIGVEWCEPPQSVNFLAEALYKTDMRHAFASWEEAYVEVRRRYINQAVALLGYLTNTPGPGRSALIDTLSPVDL